MQLERHRAWSVLLRLYHWSFALSCMVLLVTGLYIHDPWTNTMQEGSVGFPMAVMRYIHFIAGFVFTSALLARIFLLIFGNKNERVTDFIPVTPKKIKNFFNTIFYYTYLTDDHYHNPGHNPLAGFTYFLTFFIALAQILSGMYMLYPESAFWQGWGDKLLSSQQEGRFIHYLIMWFFVVFVPVHIYMCIWNDIRKRRGLISSMVNGVKFSIKKT